MRRGLSPTSWIVSSDPGSSVAATTNGAAAEKSPGTRPAEAQALGGTERDAALLARHLHAGRLEHPLGVVAGRLRLDDGRAAVRVEPGEQHARLHLRARDRQLVAHPAQLAALDRHRRLSRSSSRAGAPICRAGGDAVDRAPAQRLVAGQLEATLLAARMPGEQAQRRAGVAAVERSVRLAQPAQADAFDSQRVDVVLVTVTPSARRRQSSPRCRPSGRSRATPSRLADGAEEDGPVRDRLVSGTAMWPRSAEAGSISHRAVLLGAIGEGETTVHGFGRSGDTEATIAAMRALGATVHEDDIDSLRIEGVGLRGLREPGRAARLWQLRHDVAPAPGACLAGREGRFELTGDESLRRGIAAPLVRWAAQLESENGKPPLTVEGGELRGMPLRAAGGRAPR